LATGTYSHWHPTSDCHAPDAGKKCRGLNVNHSDADDPGVTCHPRIADIDIVAVVEKIDSGSKAHSNVVAAGCTVDERITTDAGIVVLPVALL
jgi:hypothetical protein